MLGHLPNVLLYADLRVLFNETLIDQAMALVKFIEQTLNVCRTTIVRDAWERRQELSVHGWIYALQDGLLRDLRMTITSLEETLKMYDVAMSALG